MPEPRRSLVIGLGRIGAGYDIGAGDTGGIYTHARAISLHPGFELAGGVDPVDAQRQRFEAKYGVPAYADTADAMRLARPELVVIATPGHLHLASVQEVLASGHPTVILCEKPLAFDESEGAAIVDLCRQAGVELFVNYIRRSDPGVLEIRRRIVSGEIATPVKGAFWYSKGVFNNGSHFLNLLQFWLGRTEGFDVLSPGRMWDGSDPEPDVHLRFECGSVVLQSAWEEAFSFYGGELLSPAGRLTYDEGGSTIRWRPRLAGLGSTRLAPEVEYIHNDMDRYQWNVCEQLARFLAGRPWDLCNGNEALATLKVISAFARHGEVRL